ncbi:hypothetical protein ZIOFF_024274 [Zingiber officinale]|uniref:Response regulatory domain-containing protein n=1 Tax=Zingiber officinale TaxID=94328 RepID=A0A8J5GS38_ZINOF|nr:hypothetical protein ZIOFF_024274 [Zingiber officinale]
MRDRSTSCLIDLLVVDRRAAMSSPVRGARGFGAGGEQMVIHVLAMDDSSVNWEVIASLLRSSKVFPLFFGCLIIVKAVDSGNKALELLGMESSKLREIPVIIICLEEGEEDFLLKPVSPSDVSRLSNWIR